MPTFFFSKPERVAKLHAEASRWIGTPFYPNSNTPGPDGGVSCQKLAEAIYHACGFANHLTVPEVAMAHARFSKESLMERFLDGRPEFSQEWPAEVGDLLGFRLYRAVHHMGICLGGGRFIHAMDHIGTVVASLSDGTWSSRLAKVWRPKE